MTPELMLPGEIAMLLAPGERALWVGRSGTGGIGFGDVLGSLFGFGFIGAALWGWGAVGAALGSVEGYVALAVVALGVWIAFYALVTNPRNRGSRMYAVTDRRLLFVTRRPKMRTKEIPLNPHVRVDATYERDGSGTLAFMDPISMGDPDGVAVYRDNQGHETVRRVSNPYTFHRIEDAAGVARLVEGLLRGGGR